MKTIPLSVLRNTTPPDGYRLRAYIDRFDTGGPVVMVYEPCAVSDERKRMIERDRQAAMSSAIAALPQR